MQTIERITKEALALPPKSKAKLAEKLLASLDSAAQKEVDALWAEEAETRIDAYNAGSMRAVSAEEVLRKIKLKKR